MFPRYRHPFFSMHWSFALVLSILSLTAPAARGQAAAPDKTKPVAAAEPRPTAGGMHEGIKVHGHWVIEVRRPDGKLVARREFENSFQTTGTPGLVYLLSGNGVAGGWAVYLRDPANPTTGSPCEAASSSNGSTSGGGFCEISQQQLNTCTGSIYSTASWCSETLTALLGTTSTGGSALVLSGSIQASQTGNIGEVQTWLDYCNTGAAANNTLSLSPTSPAACASLTGFQNLFTEASLLTAGTGVQCGGANQASCEVMDVTPGDSISVQVTLSFSSSSSS